MPRPQRQQELVAFIRENTSTVPWPQVELTLRERGYTAAEIAAALDEVFPGQKGRQKSGGMWGGLVGAVVAMIIWVILAIIYRATR